MSNPWSGTATVALFALAAFLLFWRLGASTFHTGDEAVYSQCAREMIARHDYLTPHYGGIPFLEKPPAKMWLIAAGFHLLGITEWGARLSSAVFAFGTVLATFLLGRALFGIVPALLGGAILITSVQFVHEHCGRTAEMEPETAFLFVTCMFLVYRIPTEPRGAWLLGLAVGCLILVKGPVALPVLVIAALYLASCRPLPAGTRRALLLGAVVMIVVAAPWHAYQLWTNGDLFRGVYLHEHLLGRFLGKTPESLAPNTQGFGTSEHRFYYLRVVFHSMFPWSLLALPATVLAAWAAVRHGSRELRLLLIWLVVFAGAISISGGKLHWYTVPLLPAMALLSAWLVVRLRDAASMALLAGGGATVLILSLILAPSPSYDPYSRETTDFPFRNGNLVAVTALERRDVAELLPLAASGVLLVVLGAALLLARREPGRVRAIVGRCVIGSLLLTGVIHAALPLRGVDNRDHYARWFANCSRALKERGLVSNRLVILDDRTQYLATRWTASFYACELAGSVECPIVRVPPGAESWANPRVLRVGTVLLGNPRWADELLATGRVEELWRGDDLFGVYVP